MGSSAQHVASQCDELAWVMCWPSYVHWGSGGFLCLAQERGQTWEQGRL